MILYLDFETRSRVPIRNGTHAYAESCEVIMTQYAIDDGPVVVTDGLDPALEMLVDMADTVVICSKDGFDRLVAHYNGIHIPVEKIHDVATQALSHGLPAGLDKLCAIFQLPRDLAKDKKGKALIQLFCVPRKDKSYEWADASTNPVEWQRFRDYGGSDILSMRELYKRIPRINYPAPREHALWCLDQRMNDRGMMVDQQLAHAAKDVVAAAKKILDKRTQEMTDENLRSTTQRDQLLRLVLDEYGVDLPDLQKATLERRVADPDLPEGARELLLMRLQTSTTTNAKYDALLRAVSNDGRLRGAIQFSGAARTKRWSGKVFQPQNLLRPDPEFTEEEAYTAAVDAVLGRYAQLLYDEPIKVCANVVRGAIIAAPSKKLVISDLAQVEARVLPWLAGEQWKLDAFEAFDAGVGFDNYIMAYSRGFGVEPELVTKPQRQTGKTSELACGYGGAYGAWASMAATLRIEIPFREKVQEIVRAWRMAHPALCDWDTGLWAALDRAARLAIANPGKTFEAGEHIRFERFREWLRMELPSGGFLNYAAPAIIDDPRYPGKDTISYMGVNNYTKKWERLTTYGGKLSADATQATAREIMAHNLLEIEAVGYWPILLVHDEVVTEVPDDPDYSADSLNTMLSRQPPWAPGLPLAAGGFETHRYRKDG